MIGLSFGWSIIKAFCGVLPQGTLNTFTSNLSNFTRALTISHDLDPYPLRVPTGAVTNTNGFIYITSDNSNCFLGLKFSKAQSISFMNLSFICFEDIPMSSLRTNSLPNNPLRTLSSLGKS